MYQLKIWYNSHLQAALLEDPAQHGWTFEDDFWKPTFSSQEPVPDYIRKALSIKCSDKSCNNNRCTCLAQGLKCWSDCKYANCSNSLRICTPESPEPEVISDDDIENF